MHQQLQDWIADLSQYMNCDPKALAEWQQTVLSGDPRSADGPWLAENLNTLWNNKLIDQTVISADRAKGYEG